MILNDLKNDFRALLCTLCWASDIFTCLSKCCQVNVIWVSSNASSRENNIQELLCNFRLSIPHDKLIPLTDRDKCKARELLERPYIKSQDAWLQEVFKDC